MSLPASMRVLVLTGDPNLPDVTKPGHHYHPEDLANIDALREALKSLERFRFEVFSDHLRLAERVVADPPDLVVNFCDTGFCNVAAQELHVPALLEMLGIPYTGAPPACMAICFDKQIVRLVAKAQGIPVPREVLFDPHRFEQDLPDMWPALIKPNRADGSLGITKDAVVRTPEEAHAYLAWFAAELPERAALIQEYLPGTEYGVGLIGNPEHELIALPALEVDYSALPQGLNPILSYESKAHPDSPYWTEIRYTAAGAEPAVLEAMVEQAKRLFARLGCRDYARFDFRVAADGEAKLMEVNPNPGWAYDAKLAMMAGFAGISYPQMLEMILDAAARRLDTAS